jgi:hypothetical protein
VGRGRGRGRQRERTSGTPCEKRDQWHQIRAKQTTNGNSKSRHFEPLSNAMRSHYKSMDLSLRPGILISSFPDFPEIANKGLPSRRIDSGSGRASLAPELPLPGSHVAEDERPEECDIFDLRL